MARREIAAVLAVAMLIGVARAQDKDDVNAAAEQAMKAAAAKAAPWVAKIETAGGREVIGGGPAGPGGPGAVRKGIGPTTGVVVDPDGYVISSAFNFANKPTDIFVTVPSRPRMVAKIIAHDTARMLTLLKVDLKDLPVPVAVPKKEIQIGQWALALGRTLDPDLAEVPSISAGIVSAVGRIWGKAIQADAKISPVNYGGPLVAIDGRAFGVIIPASPQSEADAAGVEWYDSGIGFAVPMEDVFAVVSRLKQGKDVRRGLLGITLKDPSDQYLSPVVINSVSPDSAGAKVGIKPGDRLVSIDGKLIANYAQMMFALGPKYEGDAVTVKIERDGVEQDLGVVTLSGAVIGFMPAFLGILPMRDDVDAGVEVRSVYPNSPAAEAKLAPGDRILKIAPTAAPQLSPIQNRDALAGMMTQLAPGSEVKVEVKRKDGKTETVTVRLAVAPEIVPDNVPQPSSKGKAMDRAKKPAAKKDDGHDHEHHHADEKKDDDAKKDDEKKDEPITGLLKRTNEVLGREYWVYVPSNYDRNVSHGVILWLHGAGKGGKDAKDVADIWRGFCEDNHFIVIGPRSKNAEGWMASESVELLQIVKEAMSGYTTDKSRVIAHGMGLGGQMAFYLGFAARDLIRGVATTGAALGTQPKDTSPTQPLSFYIVAGDKDPLVKEIAETKPKLTEKKFPVIYRQLADFGKEYLDTKTLDELQRWMDSLDRI